MEKTRYFVLALLCIAGATFLIRDLLRDWRKDRQDKTNRFLAALEDLEKFRRVEISPAQFSQHLTNWDVEFGDIGTNYLEYWTLELKYLSKKLAELNTDIANIETTLVPVFADQTVPVALRLRVVGPLVIEYVRLFASRDQVTKRAKDVEIWRAGEEARSKPWQKSQALETTVIT